MRRFESKAKKTFPPSFTCGKQFKDSRTLRLWYPEMVPPMLRRPWRVVYHLYDRFYPGWCATRIWRPVGTDASKHNLNRFRVIFPDWWLRCYSMQFIGLDISCDPLFETKFTRLARSISSRLESASSFKMDVGMVKKTRFILCIVRLLGQTLKASHA